MRFAERERPVNERAPALIVRGVRVGFGQAALAGRAHALFVLRVC